jgi:CxC2 like cysteine cluster associated with KDZ transposases
MREWLTNKQQEYLIEVVEKEALPSHRSCSCCHSDLVNSPIWRCTSCFAQPIFCTSCCRDQHASTPFHRVEIWNRTHFRPSWLWHTGLKISLCNSSQCSKPSNSGSENFTPPLPSVADNDDPTFGARPEGRVFGDTRLLVVVHTNGIHHVLMRFCTCDHASEDDIQLLRVGLYPSTHREVRTAFTFELLDYYLLDTLECYTSSLHFYTKLRRVTNEVFPRNVPVSSVFVDLMRTTMNQ